MPLSPKKIIKNIDDASKSDVSSGGLIVAMLFVTVFGIVFLRAMVSRVN